MAGESEIRAGGAYVEIGAKTAALDKALAGIAGKLQKSFSDVGAMMAKVGAGLSGVGVGIAGPMFAANKSFGEAAKELSVLHERTGLSYRALSGFKILARESGSSVEEFAGAIGLMQRAITQGAPEAQAGLQRLGLTIADLSGLAPEEQFNKIADAFQELSDPAERTTVAMQIFGRSGRDMIPALRGGSAALEEATQRAFRFGVGLDEAAVKKGLQADDAWDKMSDALLGLKNRLGEAAMPLVPYVEKIAEIIARCGVWIQQNPELVASIGQIGIAVAAAGACFAALGAAIMLASSPAFLVAAGIMAVGAAVLAVTDTLGVTDTGFADLFNSIQVNGRGLADWFTYIWKHIEAGWTVLTCNLAVAWEYTWGAFKDVATNGYQTVMGICELVAFGFDKMVQQIVDQLNLLVRAYNAVAETLGGSAIKLFEKPAFSQDMLDWTRKKNDEVTAGRAADKAAREKSIEGNLWKRDAALRVFGQATTAIERKDTSETGISSDVAKATAALQGIGGRVGEMLRGLMDQIVKNLPEKALGPLGYDPTQPPKKPGAPPALETSKPSWSAVGTFSGFAASQMAGAGSVFNQQLEVQRRIASASEKTAQNTQAGDAPEMT